MELVSEKKGGRKKLACVFGVLGEKMAGLRWA